MLIKIIKHNGETTALIVTTSAYSLEGIDILQKTVKIKGVFITDKTNEGTIEDIPIIVDSREVSAFICWKLVDDVFICGPDNIDVPETVLNACKQMDVPIHTTPTKKRFEYDILKIQTALQKNEPRSGLSFFEGEHDIPFRINKLYAVFDKEQDHHTGYFPHNESWHLFFCPYGTIDAYVDTGKEQKHILLDNPSTGIILHPSVWREMRWKTPGSVLCVVASGEYDTENLQTDYDSYTQFVKKKDWSAVVEYSDIMGEMIV